MAIILTDQELINAKRDIDDIGKAINEKVIVSPRYGDDFKSLPMISAEFQISSDAAEAAAASAAESAGIATSAAQNASSSANIAEAAATAATIGGKVYSTPEAGVDPVTGVADGAYFNVRSSSDESYVDEYQNVGGSAVATGKSYPSTQALVEVQQTVGVVDEKLKRENVSVWDFFTPSELNAYKLNPTTFDASRPIIEFFDYISENDVGVAQCSGAFSVTQTIRIGRAGVQNTKIVQGQLILKDIVGLDTLVQAETGGSFNWDGTIDVTGNFTGSSWIYANKKTRIGFRFLGSSANGRSNYGNIRAKFFRQAGVYSEDNTSMSLVRRVYADGIGTGYYYGQYTTAWSNLVNTDTQGSLNQRSTITVANLPEADLDCQMYIYNEGVLHLIHNIDRVNSTISVHPWIITSNTSGTLEYIWGAGLDVRGSDSSVFHADALDVTNSAVGLVARSLYLPSVSECCIQMTRLGITQGANATSAGSGGYIGNYYTEGMLFDLVFVSTYGKDGRLPILSSYESRIDRTAFIGPRTGDGSYGMLGNTATGFQYSYKGYNYYCESAFQQFKSGNYNNVDVVPIDLFSANLWRQVYYKNTIIFRLGLFTDANIMKARMFGISTGLIHVIGAGANGTPTSITFSASTDNSYTLNGGNTDLVFTNFNGPAELVIYMEIRTKNYIIRQVGAPSGGASVTYDPPSLADGTQQNTTVVLTGAKLGDNVNVSFDKPLSGTRMWGEVTSANTVTVYHRNDTGADVDVASGTLKVKLV